MLFKNLPWIYKSTQKKHVDVTINYRLVNGLLSYSCAFNYVEYHKENKLPYRADLNFSQIILTLIQARYPDTEHILFSISGEGFLNEKDHGIKLTSFSQKYYSSMNEALVILKENLTQELQNYLSGKDDSDCDAEISHQMYKI